MINAQRRHNNSNAPINEMVNFAGVTFVGRGVGGSWQSAAHGPDGKLRRDSAASRRVRSE